MIIVKPSATLLWITPDAEQVIERAGRVCYKSEEKITEDSAGAFIRKIIASGHESVIEHASASYLIVCDRGVSHELVRHRLASYSQESTRYCNYGKAKFGGEISVIEPPGLSTKELEGRSSTRSLWARSCVDAEVTYLMLLERGVSPQIARSVLPNCLKTEIAMTANLREWLHVLRLRCAPAAHPQAREIAFMILRSLSKKAPSVFAELTEKYDDWARTT